MIKAQLSTSSMLTKVKVTTATRDGGQHRSSGPFKAYNIRGRSESLRSETSISRRSVTEEVLSVTSCSVRCSTDAETDAEAERRSERRVDAKTNRLDHVKR